MTGAGVIYGTFQMWPMSDAQLGIRKNINSTLELYSHEIRNPWYMIFCHTYYIHNIYGSYYDTYDYDTYDVLEMGVEITMAL